MYRNLSYVEKKLFKMRYELLIHSVPMIQNHLELNMWLGNCLKHGIKWATITNKEELYNNLTNDTIPIYPTIYQKLYKKSITVYDFNENGSIVDFYLRPDQYKKTFQTNLYQNSMLKYIHYDNNDNNDNIDNKNEIIGGLYEIEFSYISYYLYQIEQISDQKFQNSLYLDCKNNNFSVALSLIVQNTGNNCVNQAPLMLEKIFSDEQRK